MDWRVSTKKLACQRLAPVRSPLSSGSSFVCGSELTLQRAEAHTTITAHSLLKWEASAAQFQLLLNSGDLAYHILTNLKRRIIAFHLISVRAIARLRSSENVIIIDARDGMSSMSLKCLFAMRQNSMTKNSLLYGRWITYTVHRNWL